MKSSKCIIIAGGIAFLVSASTQAASVAYEDFDYAGGTSLTTETGGLYSTLEVEPTSWQVTESGAKGVDLRSLRMLTDGDGAGGLRVDEFKK